MTKRSSKPDPVTAKPVIVVTYDKAGFPDTCPLLSEADLVWNHSTQDNRHDLLIWVDLVFNPDYPLVDAKARRVAYDTLCAVLTERTKKTVTDLYLFLEQVYKAKKPGKAWLAACWNEMAHRLGYVVAKESRQNPDRR